MIRRASLTPAPSRNFLSVSFAPGMLASLNSFSMAASMVSRSAWDMRTKQLDPVAPDPGDDRVAIATPKQSSRLHFLGGAHLVPRVRAHHPAAPGAGHHRRDTFQAIAKRYQARKTGPTAPRVMKPKHALIGLLVCGVCGGTFGVVRSTKEGYRILGCVAHRDRGPSACANNKTISDRKVIKALGAHLRDHMGKPDRLEKFINAFQDQYQQREKAGADPRAEMLAKVEKARQTVAQATQALILVPTSQAMAQRLQAEESALAALEIQLEALQPRVIPHPAAVAAYVARLADVLEAGDLVRAGDILRSALAPFKLHPQAVGYRLTGALNLGVSEQESSGGVI